MSKSEGSTRGEGCSVNSADGHANESRNGRSPDAASERLSTARREMAAMVREATMRAMMASIAHELSQPLTAIVTNANAGLRWLGRPEPDVDEVRALLARIVRDGHRTGGVIAGIRSKFGEDRNEPSAVSLNDEVAGILELLDGELASRQVLVKNEMLAGLPRLMVDRARLQLALFNLVVNAIEAMESITDRHRVLTITCRPCESDDLLVTLEDSGTGIDPDHMDRMFEAFFTTKAHHTGMGLPICRKIIESHGGRLWASARHPHGSAFFVRLPIVAASDNNPRT
jgi:C4-dicarboxylate-specific signal transduction histidine kinase